MWNLIVIIDNTWLTHVIFNPFEYGADIVCSSLTKYYSGGHVIAGITLFADSELENELSNIAKTNARILGFHFSPADGKIINYWLCWNT